MRFIDEAKISVAGGHGGPGCVSFRRETFAPRGGPDGGDGGKGGSVIFIASEQLSTLQDLRFKRKYVAENGHHGSGSNKTGRDGEDITVRIPVGTQIKDPETGEILIDFKSDGEEWVAATGGRGGKGNAHFVSSTFQAPKFAQPGEEGTTRELLVELKLLADVGIIGFPNAGKSTLISRISAARPKIADYPFTTLTPNLGVVQRPSLESFVVADIPGLVEGAHRGLGLGHKFLKHIERTRLFVHLVDGTQFLEDATADGDDSFDRAIDSLVKRYGAIREELRLFSQPLTQITELVVINKCDVLEGNPELLEKARNALKKRIVDLRDKPPLSEEPIMISAATGFGIESLLQVLHRELKKEKSVGLTTDHSLAKAAVRLPSDQSLR